MRIVVAPNAFKGCLSAAAAATAMAAGVRRARPDAEIVAVPVADGGDGLVEVMAAALGGALVEVTVTGPLFTPVLAPLCLVERDRFAAIEMARASGLALVPPAERDPTQTTTLGTGELIAAALDRGARRIAVGIGGSATTDGGIGMATALGIRFLDADGHRVRPVGGELGRIRRIDAAGRDPRLAEIRIEVLCDVDNPLCGPDGAAAVFGPQKGATAEQVARLDAGLAHLAALIARDLGIDVWSLRGGGAAGGLGAGLHAFLGATLRRGVDLVLELVGLDAHLAGADLVLTGEGRLDAQTACGKAPAGVAAACRRHGVPCVAIGGSIDDGTPLPEGMAAAFSLCPRPMTLEAAMRDAAPLLAAQAEQVVRLFTAAAPFAIAAGRGSR